MFFTDLIILRIVEIVNMIGVFVGANCVSNCAADS